MRKFFVFLALIITTSTHAWAYRPLKEGDDIRLIAPSRGITEDHKNAIVQFLENAGYRATYGEQTFNFSYPGPEANSYELRGKDFVEAFESGAKFVWAVCGGFGAIDVIDYLDSINYDPSTVSAPPIIVGFSDVTVLHLWARKHGIISLHGPNIGQGTQFCNYTQANPDQNLLQTLRGLELPVYCPCFEAGWLNPNENQDDITGLSAGGCFSIIQRTFNTPIQLDGENKILLLEDTSGEVLARQRTMFRQFKLAGVFKQIRALVFGYMTFETKGTVKHLKQLIEDYDITIPVIHLPMVGHGRLNVPFPLGVKATLKFNAAQHKAHLSLPLGETG